MRGPLTLSAILPDADNICDKRHEFLRNNVRSFAIFTAVRRASSWRREACLARDQNELISASDRKRAWAHYDEKKKTPKTLELGGS